VAVPIPDAVTVPPISYVN